MNYRMRGFMPIGHCVLSCILRDYIFVTKFIERLGLFVFLILFFGGYFPVNMIMAYIHGDKMDVIISFFLPFYGYLVMILGRNC